VHNKRILKDIKVPKTPPQAKHPFADLEVGDGIRYHSRPEFLKARSAMSSWRQTHPDINLKSRVQKPGGIIWRAEK
jgi:hypothetical protein